MRVPVYVAGPYRGDVLRNTERADGSLSEGTLAEVQRWRALGSEPVIRTWAEWLAAGVPR